VDDSQAQLERRARDIESYPIADQVLIYLTMKEGRLEIKADAEKILDASWNPGKGEKRHWKRAGSGKMSRILSVVRSSSDMDWRDDRLEDAGGKPITVSANLRPGRIQSVDCFPGRERLLFFGNNRARVCRLDLDQSLEYCESPILGGVVRDILVVPHPDLKGEAGVFAACDDGIIYLLDERSDQNRLRIAHRQYMDRHVRQLIGVDRDLVALDESQNIISLRVGSQDLETKLLCDFVRLALRLCNLASDNHPLWSNPNRMDSDDRERLAILALDAYLLLLEGNDSIEFDTDDFQLFCEWLVESYAGHGTISVAERASLHSVLLQRVWKWLEESKETQRDLPGDGLASITVPLWRLLLPPVDVPDYVWMSLLYRADILTPWIARFGDDSRRILEDQHRDWQACLPEMRKLLLPGLHGIRHLSVLSSTCIAGRPRHICVVDPPKGLVALVEYGYGLRLVKVPQEIDQRWQLLGSIPHEKDWYGIPRALASGKGLRVVLPQARNDPCVLVATDRGELRLYCVERSGESLALICTKDLEMDVRCCSIVDYRQMSGVLLGGANKDGRACLHWLRVQGTWGQLWMTSKEIWADKHPDGSPRRGGFFRMLSVVETSNGVYLWAADRRRGNLYRWLMSEVGGSKGVPSLVEERVVLRNRKDLYSVSGDRTKKSAVVLSGGHDALTLALDKENTTLRWVVSTAKRLNRAFFIPHIKQWVLCSDHRNAILVGEDGVVHGSLMNIGPISGGQVVDETKLLLGTQDGRILLLSSGGIDWQEEPRIPSDIDSLHEHLNYPIRTRAELDLEDLANTLTEATGSDSVMKDHLCLLAFLHRVWKPIEQRGLERPVARALVPLLQQLPVALLASFLSLSERQKIRQASPQMRAELSWLNARLWYGLKYREDNLAHQPRVILETLELDFIGKLDADLNGAVRERHGIRSAREEDPRPAWSYLSEPDASLFRYVVNCIWWNDGCPRRFWNSYRISGLQVGQAARMWNESRRDSGRSDCQRLNRWLDLLWRLWGTEAPGKFLVDLRSLLNQGIPLIAEPWGSWLANLVYTSPNDHPEGSLRRALGPLDMIENPRLEPWSEAELEQLYSALPGDQAWGRWLDEAQGRLLALQDIREARDHVGWKEKGEINALMEHIDDGVQKQFSFASCHGLLVLWWPHLRNRWKAMLDARLSDMDLLRPADYLKVVFPEDECWISGKEILLSVRLHNRYHYDINVQSAEWNGQPVDMGRENVKVDASASSLAEGVACSIQLKTDTINTLKGILKLHCVNAGMNEYFSVTEKCEKTRDLRRFFHGELWTETGKRLSRLLTDQTPFVWLDGYYWSEDDRDLLKGLILTQFNVKVGTDIEVAPSLEEMLTLDKDVFCPDFPLDEKIGPALVDWFHRVLHNPRRPAFNPVALAIWHRAHPIPITIAYTLRDYLPDGSNVADLLIRLLGSKDLVDALDHGISVLPSRAIGAWCYGDPVYAELMSMPDPTHFSLNDLYEAPVSLIEKTAWDHLNKCPNQEIADWLKTEPENLRYSLVSALFDTTKSHEVGAVDHAARTLLGKLGKGRIHCLGPGSVWHLDTREKPIVLLENEYKNCYLVIGHLPEPVREKLADDRKSLWLSLIDLVHDPAGTFMPLNYNDCLKLIHTTDLPAAHRILNQLLATKVDITPGSIFRVAQGMGGKRRLVRHFFGRGIERRTLHGLLEEHDDPVAKTGTAVLIIGGRRIGKTSLREWP